MYWNSWRIHSKKQKASRRKRKMQKRREQQLQQLLVLRRPGADSRTAVNPRYGLRSSALHDLRNCLGLFFAVNWRLWYPFSSEEFSKANIKVLLSYWNNPMFGCMGSSPQLCLIWSNRGSLEPINGNWPSVYISNLNVLRLKVFPLFTLQYFMSKQAEFQISKWSCCYMKTKPASQESDLILSDVLTNSTSNVYLLLSLCRDLQSSSVEE